MESYIQINGNDDYLQVPNWKHMQYNNLFLLRLRTYEVRRAHNGITVPRFQYLAQFINRILCFMVP